MRTGVALTGPAAAGDAARRVWAASGREAAPELGETSLTAAPATTFDLSQFERSTVSYAPPPTAAPAASTVAALTASPPPVAPPPPKSEASEGGSGIAVRPRNAARRARCLRASAEQSAHSRRWARRDGFSDPGKRWSSWREIAARPGYR